MSIKDYSTVEAGLRQFVRLIPLRRDPMELKYIQDEFDLLEAIDTVRIRFKETAEMFGKWKYRETPFNFIEDVKEEMEEWLLNANEPIGAALRRKRYQPMYHLVLTPIIDLFAKDTHATCLRSVDAVLDEVVQLIENHPYGGTYDDAIVARTIIGKDIRAKEQARMAKITRRQKKQFELIEEIAELAFE